MWHECMDQHPSPVCARVQRGNQVRDEGQTQYDKDLHDRLKAMVHSETPQKSRNWNDEPGPEEASDQFESAANSDQVACDQRNIGNDQDKHSKKNDPTSIILPQDVSQPLLSDTAYFCTGELNGLIHRRREHHQPEVAIAYLRSI